MAGNVDKLKKSWQMQMVSAVPEWHVYQGHTNDCGPFCTAMLANTLLDAPAVDADSLARAMEEPVPGIGRLIPSRIEGWATFPWGVVRALRGLDLQARWHVGSSIQRLIGNLSRNLLTVVIVGEPLRFRKGRWSGWSHYKVLYAWHPQHGWAFVDPQATEDVVFSYQDAASFQRQWSLMGRIVIEAWRDKR